MQWSLGAHFALGLADSILKSPYSESKWGVGTELHLELHLNLPSENPDKVKKQAQLTLAHLTEQLDHVHLDKDHSGLKNSHLNENTLLDWLWQEISKDPILSSVVTHLKLRSPQNFSIIRTKKIKGSRQKAGLSRL